MAYIGCVLFALIFLLMSAVETGSLQERMAHTLDWIHRWAPYSYVVIAIVVLAPMLMVRVMHSWPARKEPEDPMAKYRRQAAQGLEEAED